MFSSILLAIEIQHHGISSSTPPIALLVSCTRTLRELLPPPFGRVASLELSLVLGRVASLPSYSPLLPRVGHLPQASSPVNGSVAVAGNRRSSGPGGPAAWYCTISWQHRSVRSAVRKSRDLVSVLPPSHFSGCYSRVLCFVPVARLQLSTLTLAEASCSPPLKPTTPWWHFIRSRRCVALPR